MWATITKHPVPNPDVTCITYAGEEPIEHNFDDSALNITFCDRYDDESHYVFYLHCQNGCGALKEILIECTSLKRILFNHTDKLKELAK